MKKVKFEVDSKEFNSQVIEDEELENDLDLDTIKASRNKSKGLKEFDSEDEDEEGYDNEDINGNDSSGSDIDSESDSVHVAEILNYQDSLDSTAEIDDRQIPLEPFSLKADREEGSFDSQGFYTKNHDEEADQDRWMAHIANSDIQKARRAHLEREMERQKRMREQSERSAGRSERELWQDLAAEMDGFDSPNLTLLNIISSLKSPPSSSSSHAANGRAPLNKNRLKKLQKEQGLMMSANQDSNAKMSEENRAKLEKMTELADALMDLGYFGVYEETRRDILRRQNK